MSDMKAELRKAFQWLFAGDTGMSSEAILGHMVAGVSSGRYPYDPSDLGRCLRLLDKFPHWEPRIPEMAKYGPVWVQYSLHWPDLRKSMEEETGTNWEKGKSAPKTYELMKRLQAASKAKQVETATP